MILLAPALLFLVALWQPQKQPQEPLQERPLPQRVVVRQSGEADVLGSDDVALKAGLARLGATGGTLLIGPGRYVLRRMLFLPINVTLEGEDGAVLALPSPALLATGAEAGSRALEVAGEHEFQGESRLQILPPVGAEFFADGSTRSLELRGIERVEGQTLHMLDALPFAIPAASRVGYPHKMFWVNKLGLAHFENLTFAGGRIESIPMPGHSQRCAIWASAPFGFEEQRLGPPGLGVEVRHCRFSDLYGRGVALYNQEDGLVEGCLFERISDEAIDLDHFVERFRITGNTIRNCTWGIVLNDASRNVVEFNHIDGVEIGIWCWRYERTPGEHLNQENLVRNNLVRGARQAAIDFDATCVRNVIEFNFLEGELRVVEPDNVVRSNTQL